MNRRGFMAVAASAPLVPSVVGARDLFRVIHKDCDGLALYTAKKWKFGDVISQNDVWLIDGRKPNTGDMIVCGSCGDAISIGPETVRIEYKP